MYSLIEMKEPSLYITLLNEILIKQLKVWKKYNVDHYKPIAYKRRTISKRNVYLWFKKGYNGGLN